MADTVITPVGFSDPSLEAADREAERIAAQNRLANPQLNADEAKEADFDDLMKDIQTDRNDVETNNNVTMPLEGAPKDAPKPKEEAPATEPAPVAEEKPAAPKGILDSVLANSEASTTAKPAESDPYDVKLRSDASPKTQETFANLKQIARQREEAALAKSREAEGKLQELQAKVAELEKKSMPDEVKTELEELRQFKAQFAYEQTAEFKSKYDDRIGNNYNSIYQKLQDHGLPESEVAKLKAFAPAERDQAIETFLDKLPPVSKRFIELKLAESLTVNEERQRALQEARGRSSQILEEQKKAPVQQAERRIAEVATILKPAIAKINWLQVQDIPQGTAPEVKKQIEAANAAALELQEDLKRGIVDDSPQTRAEAAMAIPYAKFLMKENAALKERLTAAEKKLNDISDASKISRTARSAASPNARPAAPRPTTEDAGESLDSIFNEVQGQNRR